jgi:uncharacterized protein
MRQDLERKEDHLREFIGSLESVIVAFSGGVDSAYVAFVAHEVLGDQALAVTADSPSLAASQREDALSFAGRFNLQHLMINTGEFDNPNYRANPANRCYYCKHELYTRLRQLADEQGFRVVCDGVNLDDVSDYRPGRQAARELAVISPLIVCGMTKNDVRQLSHLHGLPTWDKPASACLSSRIPYGMEVTMEKLRAIEKGEEVLRQLGFSVFRVRHHGDIVRLEFAKDELPRAMTAEMAERLVSKFKALGFKYVTLDLEGYRMGALNEALPIRLAAR